MTAPFRSEPMGPAHRLTIDRPERRNALTPELCLGLTEQIDRVSALGEARAILLAGAGGHFCVGGDLQFLGSAAQSGNRALFANGLHAFQGLVLSIVRSPLPVIALCTGSTAGFGLDLALACDLRLAATGATFTSAFAKMGLVPDGGSTHTLPALVGRGTALRILLAGETIDAAWAERLGLVDEVTEPDDLDDLALHLVQGMAGQSAASLATIKRLTRASELAALEPALAAEGAAQLEALQGDEFAMRVRAFFDRKKEGA